MRLPIKYKVPAWIIAILLLLPILLVDSQNLRGLLAAIVILGCFLYESRSVERISRRSIIRGLSSLAIVVAAAMGTWALIALTDLDAGLAWLSGLLAGMSATKLIERTPLRSRQPGNGVQ